MGQGCILGTALLSTMVFGLLVEPAIAMPTPPTWRVSISSLGAQGDNFSNFASTNSDGRYVAFESLASTLVPGDTNGAVDVFVYDRQTAQLSRISVSSGGAQGNARSKVCTISADGRFVAFHSEASNLVPVDTAGVTDIFEHDRQTGQTTRVSVSSTGEQANGYCDLPSISADGRYVAFQSQASNLVAGDTNGAFDVFVHDRQLGQTTRVSIATGGGQANGPSGQASISADGRYVAFFSVASNLVAADTSGFPDVFVHDRQTGQTTRVSVSSGGLQGNGGSFFPSINADGRYVAFHSGASNLVAGDTNGAFDAFVYDRQTAQTSRVSISSGGQQGNAGSGVASISADGRYVAFYSDANNMVPGDTNGASDVFVFDRVTALTARLSVSTAAQEGNGPSNYPRISGNGQFVAFHSDATNLVVGDTNGWTDAFVRQYLASTTPPSVPSSSTVGILIGMGVLLLLGAATLCGLRNTRTEVA